MIMMSGTTWLGALTAAAAAMVVSPQAAISTQACSEVTCGERVVLVAPFADREIVRGLRQEGFRPIYLRPYHHHRYHHRRDLDLGPENAAPLVLGTLDLYNAGIRSLIQETYDRGDAVGITYPWRRTAGRLIDLVDPSGSVWPEEKARARFFALRLVHDGDGRLHPSTYTSLLPDGVDAWEARRERPDQQLLDWMAERLGPEPPVLAAADGDPSGNDLTAIAKATHVSYKKENSVGSGIEIDNFIWSARSFGDQQDFYYVLQQVSVFNACDTPTTPGRTAEIGNVATPSDLVSSTIQPSPGTTQEATTITSGVTTTIGASVGFSTSGIGVNVSASVAVSNSRTTTVPPTMVQNQSDPIAGNTGWDYEVNPFPSPTEVVFFNQWIWTVDFSAYPQPTPSDFSFDTGSNLLAGAGCDPIQLQGVNAAPLPFNTFTILPPTITSVSPTSVAPGEQFTIQGTGLYPGLVGAVLLDGVAVDSANLDTVSDTEITVIAPPQPGVLPVVVTTTEGPSNTNLTIDITN